MDAKKSAWLIPCNVGLYDPFGAFSTLDEVDWRQSSQVIPGDVVYIYCSRPYSKVMFKTIVIESNIPAELSSKNDIEYHKTPGKAPIGNPPRYGYMRLKQLAFLDCEQLSLNMLAEFGLVSAPQGPRRLTGDLLKYISDRFTHA